MKRLRYYLIPAVLGLYFAIEGTGKNEIASLGEIVRGFAFFKAGITSSAIVDFMLCLFPLFVFQIIWGNYMYQHFCVASVYYFTRLEKRNPWYFKETGKLLISSVMYIFVMIAAGTLYKGITSGITIGKNDIILFLYYMMIYSFYLFSTTLAINVISIKIGSLKAIYGVIGIQIFSMTLFGLWEKWIDFSAHEIEEMQTQIWALKLNPISQLVLKWHSSSNEELDTLLNEFGIKFDLNFSLVYILVITAVIVWIGRTITAKAECYRATEE